MGKTYRYRPDDDYQGSSRSRKKSGHSNNRKTRGIKTVGSSGYDDSDDQYEYGIMSEQIRDGLDDEG